MLEGLTDNPEWKEFSNLVFRGEPLEIDLIISQILIPYFFLVQGNLETLQNERWIRRT